MEVYNSFKRGVRIVGREDFKGKLVKRGGGQVLNYFKHWT